VQEARSRHALETSDDFLAKDAIRRARHLDYSPAVLASRRSRRADPHQQSTFGSRRRLAHLPGTISSKALPCAATALTILHPDGRIVLNYVQSPNDRGLPSRAIGGDGVLGTVPADRGRGMPLRAMRATCYDCEPGYT
jgi:hypothetical protein